MPIKIGLFLGKRHNVFMTKALFKIILLKAIKKQ